MLGAALRNARQAATTAARSQLRNMGSNAAPQAARGGYGAYHDQLIKKGDYSPVIHCILFMWVVGYANDYTAHLQHEKKQQGGPEIIWPH